MPSRARCGTRDRCLPMSPSPEPGARPGALPPDAGLASLYQEIILQHYRAPLHKGVLDAALPGVEHRNPLCGDVLSMQLAVSDGRVEDAAFSARACSITQATASMLLDRIIGRTVTDARQLLAEVESLIDRPLADGSGTVAASLGDLRALQSVSRFPARKACVRLVTHALREALSEG